MLVQIVLRGDTNEADYERSRQRVDQLCEDLRGFLRRECGVETQVIGEHGPVEEYKTPSLEIVNTFIFPLR